MTFISYAQNLEDVILWRVLGDIDKGFYIDVGANDPNLDSVTKAFYERGWRGINIEPMQHYHERLCAERPDDINLEIAVGETAGILPFFEIPDSGLSTLDCEIAAGHKEAGWTVIEHRIPVVTLTDVCRDCANGDIHFLKIDVEGAEHLVLAGMDFQQYRPWVVVVEATLPGSQQESYAEWEPLFLEKGYRFVYFDGLNRFYLAAEREALSSRFNAPPNLFDHYVHYSEVSVQERCQAVERELAEKRQIAEQTLGEKQAIEQQFAELTQQTDQLRRAQQALEAQLAEQKELALQLQSEKQVIEQQFAELTQQDDQLRQDRQALEAQLAEQKELALQLQSEKQVIEQRLKLVWAATSWRVTAPLRALKISFRHLKKRTARGRRALLGLMRGSYLSTGRRLLRLMKRSSRLRRLALKISRRFPKLWIRLRCGDRRKVQPGPQPSPPAMSLDEVIAEASSSSGPDDGSGRRLSDHFRQSGMAGVAIFAARQRAGIAALRPGAELIPQARGRNGG